MSDEYERHVPDGHVALVLPRTVKGEVKMQLQQPITRAAGTDQVLESIATAKQGFVVTGLRNDERDK